MNAKPCNLTFAARSKGGFAAGQRKRREAIARLAGLTAVQIYRLAYSAGWHQGRRAALRKIRKWAA